MYNSLVDAATWLCTGQHPCRLSDQSFLANLDFLASILGRDERMGVRSEKLCVTGGESPHVWRLAELPLFDPGNQNLWAFGRYKWLSLWEGLG